MGTNGLPEYLWHLLRFEYRVWYTLAVNFLLLIDCRSPKEVYAMVMDCLNAMEKKVDAAFGKYRCIQIIPRLLMLSFVAIVLECVKLLSDMDPILLSCFSSDENPFLVLDWYLNACNLNLKYLGLIGMAYVDHSFWKPNWLDGTLIADTIKTSCFDDTIVTQAIENLDTIINIDILMNTSHVLIEPCSQNVTLAYWLLNRINEHCVDRNEWYIETVMQIIAATEKRLDDDYVETQCSLLKEGNPYSCCYCIY